MSNLSKPANKYKNRVVLIIVLFLLLVLIVGGILYRIFSNKIDKSTIQFNLKNDTIERVYGDELDLSSIIISYKKYNGDKVEETVKKNMISNYDSEYIGNQEIEITFQDVIQKVQVNTTPAKISTPKLELSNNELTWTSIPNSSGYQIRYGTSETSLDHLCDVKTTNYDLSSFENYGHYYFSVRALKESEKYNDSEWSNNLKIYNLEKTYNIEYSNGKFIWDKVEGANSYTIEINGEKHEGIIETEYKYNFDNKGEYEIIVYAYSNEQNSLYSKSTPKIFTVLDPVSNVYYSDGYLNWNSVSNADSYDVYVNDNLYIKSESSKLDVTKFETGIFNFSIIAMSNNSTIIESPGYSFKALLNYELSIKNGIVTWPSLANDGISYHVIIDGVEETNSNSNFEINLNSYNLEAGSHTIEIKVFSNEKILLDTSKSLNVKKLKAPILSVSNGTIIGNNKENNLKLFKDGINFEGQIELINKAGSYSIVGKYLASNDNELDSDMSDELIITKYEKPVIDIENGKMKIDSPSRLVKYYLNNEEFDGNLSNIIVSGDYLITAKYLSSNELTIDSDISDVITITKLSYPEISLISGNLTCDDSSKNIQYYLDGKEFDGNLTSISSGEVHIITARYISKGKYELDSENSNSIKVKKLQAPILLIVNNVIKCDDSSKIVKFYLDGVEHEGDLNGISSGNHVITAKYYSSSSDELDSEETSLNIYKLTAPIISMENSILKINDSTNEIKWYVNGEEFDGDTKNILEGINQISAKYISEESLILDSEISNILNIRRYEAPKLQYFSQKIVCLENGINIQYYLDGEEFDGDYSSIGKGTHVVNAKNIGDGKTTLDSCMSNDLSIYKSDVGLEYEVSHKLYEFDTSNNYIISDDNIISQNVLGDNKIGKLTITGNITNKTTFRNEEAYGANGNISFSYSYNGLYQTSINTDWNLISDTSNYVDDQMLSGNVAKGAMIVQKSYTGDIWANVFSPIINYYEDNKSGSINFYTSSDEDIYKGVYYWIIFAYELGRKIGESGSLWWKDDVYEYKRYAEVYTCYVTIDTPYNVLFENLPGEEYDYTYDGCSINSVKIGEILKNGDTTISGFSIDIGEANYLIGVSLNGGDVFYVNSGYETVDAGKYEITIISKIGTIFKNTFYVFNVDSNNVFSTYFGDCFINGNLISRDENCPVYTKNTFLHINAIDSNMPALIGYIVNNTTGETINFDGKNREERNISLSSGVYSGELYSGNNTNGSFYKFTINFIIDNDDYKSDFNYSYLDNIDDLSNFNDKTNIILFQFERIYYIKLNNDELCIKF